MPYMIASAVPLLTVNKCTRKEACGFYMGLQPTWNSSTSGWYSRSSCALPPGPPPLGDVSPCGCTSRGGPSWITLSLDDSSADSSGLLPAACLVR
jgi:hypothetical protein